MVFTGKAIYDTGVFDTIAEDVADQIGMISPYETPFLDILGDAPFAADNVLHEWLEDELSPVTVVSSLTTTPAATAIPVYRAGDAEVGQNYQVGAVFKNQTTGEYLQVTAVAANTLTFSRGFAGTSAATITNGDNLYMISDASLEGADVTVDTSRPRARLSNYCQIFKKDVIISGTTQAVNHLGVSNEWEYQKMKKMRENLRDLEKAVILGKLSGNTLGSATAYRTFKGVWDFISTNSSSLGTLTPDTLDDVIKLGWDNGGIDNNIILVDATWRRVLDRFNADKMYVTQGENDYRRKVTLYESTYGTMQIVLCRWMPVRTLMVLATDRIEVLPLRGRSFRFIDVAPTGDAMKGMLLGEYTIQLKNEKGMAKAYG